MSEKKKETGTGEKIEKAAIYEFATHGFHGARIDRIAQKAKVNKAMIYYHYKGKEALYEHVLGLITTDIYEKISPLIPEDAFSEEVFRDLVRGYAGYIAGLDGNRIRIIMRELTSGGKYFRKIAVPILMMPVMSRISAMFTHGTEARILRQINPLYTMIQVVGSIIFFNILRNAMQDSSFFTEKIFHGDYIREYTENILKIYEGGIFNRGGVMHDILPY